MKSLESFLNNDKKRIDDLLKLEYEYNKELEIKFFIPEQQENFLKIIEKYRGKTIGIKKENKEIKLKKITLKKIGHFEEIEIDLSKKITCLLGENGTGKTTILRAIALALAGTDHKEEYFDKKIIENLLQIQDTKSATLNYAEQGSIKLEYETDKKHENNIIFSKNNGNVVIEDLIIEASMFESVVDTSIFRVPIFGFSQVQRAKDKALKLKLINNVKQPNLSDIIHLISNIPDNRFSTINDWLFDIYEDKELLIKFHDLINKITNENIKISSTGKKQGNKIVNITTTGVNNGIPIDLISLGLNNVIIWIAVLIKRLHELTPAKNDFRQTKAIVLIDEIDTHLHPKWQKNILNTLSDVFPNIQFIVTTHSPLLVINLKNESKKIYNIEINKIVNIDYSYGSNINTFLYNYMQIKERPSEIENKIDKLFELIEDFDNNKINEIFEKFKNLYNLLGENDEYIIQAKILFELNDIKIIYDDKNKVVSFKAY